MVIVLSRTSNSGKSELLLPFINITSVCCLVPVMPTTDLEIVIMGCDSAEIIVIFHTYW